MRGVEGAELVGGWGEVALGAEAGECTAEVFSVGSASGKAEDAGQAALHSLSPADGLCIVEVMAAARRTRASTSETH